MSHTTRVDAEEMTTTKISLAVNEPWRSVLMVGESSKLRSQTRFFSSVRARWFFVERFARCGPCARWSSATRTQVLFHTKDLDGGRRLAIVRCPDEVFELLAPAAMKRGVTGQKDGTNQDDGTRYFGISWLWRWCTSCSLRLMTH